MAEPVQSTKQTSQAARRRPTSAPALQVPVASMEQRASFVAGVQRAIANPRLARPADILALHDAAGNRAVTRLVQTRQLVQHVFRRVADIDVAGILDYERLARQIHDAIAGLGTDEEAVYSALQRLQREPVAISQLEAVYSNRYGESLEQAIRGDFSGTELEYALQLINRGRPIAAQAIASVPSNMVEFQASARRLHEAVEGWGTDEEAINAVLTPLHRNLALIRQLSTAYQDLYREDLRGRIVDEMSGSELDFALYLLGEERMETTNISMAEATRLFNALSRSTFLTSTGTEAPVPFHFPPDGCYDRAHVMATILTQMGYASEKVFAVSRASSGGAGLRVATEYAEDVPPGMQPEVAWWYHVAPVIRVSAGAQGGTNEMVLDPSMMDRPVPIVEWTGRMNSSTFSRLTLSQLESELRAHPDYPRNRPLTYTASRHTYYPIEAGGPPATPEQAESLHESNRPRLTTYAAMATVHELAAAVRRALGQASVNADDIVNAINAAQPLARQNLWALFPNLRQEVSDVLDPADMARVESAINTP